jgi:hypothetical protein
MGVETAKHECAVCKFSLTIFVVLWVLCRTESDRSAVQLTAQSGRNLFKNKVKYY